MKWIKFRSIALLAFSAMLLTNCQEDELVSTESAPAKLEASAYCKPVYGRGFGTRSDWKGYDPYRNYFFGQIKHGSFQLEQGIRINKSADKHFWAVQFWFHNGDGGYMGLQDGAHINGKKQRVAIFSIWSALASETFFPNMGGIAQKFSGEGNGYQVLVPFDWKEGVQYNVQIYQQIKEYYNTAVNWWTVRIYWVINGKYYYQYVGNIKVPGYWGWLQPASGAFVEFWDPGSINSCKEIPLTRAYFYLPKLDGSKKADYVRGSTYKVQPEGCPELCEKSVYFVNKPTFSYVVTGTGYYY